MKTRAEQVQMQIYENGDKRATLLPVSFEDWERKAKDTLAAGPFDYVHGAAGAGDTLKANLNAFQRYRIRPRVCCAVEKRDLSVNLFGSEMPVPFLLAPIGVNSILHSEAETAPARAAAELGVPYVLSQVSTKSMEEVADVMGEGTRWFQLYPPRDHELTKSFLGRAEAAGYQAIVVTVDSPLLGWREKDLNNAYLPFLKGEGCGNYFSDEVFLSRLEQPPQKDVKAAAVKALEEGNHKAFTWKEFEFIRQQTSLPLLIKGVTHPEDAALAIEHGADGIIVSNHGGRQLDGAIATLEALPSIRDRVDGRVPILMDSGIRRGADILKAIALGATAVLIGRPYAYALAVAGESGVKEVMKHLIAELELELALSGRGSIKEVDESLIMKVD
ncbi:MAG: alpha-hydroxy-acid oxidizing protein [Bacillaceae bacterium]|nr:alpha-hydroxy-acid oxidizing protein [Bacillaceae bacterium]